MIAPLRVITEARPSHWVRSLVDALRMCGIDVRDSDVVGAETLDVRSPKSRARVPKDGWYLEIGGERGGIPAFEEAVAGADAVNVVLGLQRDGHRWVVRSGRFPYASRHARTMERIVHQCASWLRGELAFPTATADLQRHAAAQARSVTLWDRARFIVREAARWLGHALRYAFEESRWDVAVTNMPVERFVMDPRSAWLHWLGHDDREFLADPFVVKADDGGPRVLCETLDGSTPIIVSIDLDDRFGERQRVVAGDGPTSYPHVVEVDGELWLTPEQHRRRCVSAYRLNGTATLLPRPLLQNIAAVDSTIVRHGDLWWLFCTDKEDGVNYALRIFWSRHPSGPWYAHARNPAKIDIGGARPAGNFFVRDGVLHRPAQDCTGRYGRAIVIQRIDVLTPEEFSETCVGRIDASAAGRKGVVGVHTLSHGEGWVALDAQFARWSLRKPLRILRGQLA